MDVFKKIFEALSSYMTWCYILKILIENVKKLTNFLFLLNEYLKKNFTFLQFFQLTTNLPTYLQSLKAYKRPLLI